MQSREQSSAERECVLEQSRAVQRESVSEQSRAETEPCRERVCQSSAELSRAKQRAAQSRECVRAVHVRM